MPKTMAEYNWNKIWWVFNNCNKFIHIPFIYDSNDGTRSSPSYYYYKQSTHNLVTMMMTITVTMTMTHGSTNTIARSMPKKMKKDFRQSTKAEIDSWKINNALSTTNNLSKAPQNLQDKWQEVMQISNNCPSDKLCVWVDCKLLLLLLFLLSLFLLVIFVWSYILYIITIFYF